MRPLGASGGGRRNPLPFAVRCAHGPTERRDKFEYELNVLLARFAYAQDARRRDVVIKLVDKGSMEHQIYEYLAECQSLYDERTFENVLPPTAILGSPYGFAFVAMPMWGTHFLPDQLDTPRQILTFIRDTLTGLAFLHRHRIAHRDIDPSNMLVNWYCSDAASDGCDRRWREHRRSAAVIYVLFDFDLSLQLPPQTSLKKCRRPAEEAFTGKKMYYPYDVYQGEPYYNPFAFDVACLGNLYLCWFIEAIPVIPLLAPLIGKMTTHVVDDRWSAEEALAFFPTIQAGLLPDVLDSSVTLQLDFGLPFSPGLYWTRLSPEFQSEWRSHRPPPLSWITRLLRWINTTRVGWTVVRSIRRYFQI